MKVTMIPIVIGALRTTPKGSSRRLKNQKTSRDRPGYSSVKIGQNTEKSPGEMRSFAVTQTPVKYQGKLYDSSL